MSRPSRFDIMRRNRDRRRSVAALIDAVESDIDREWAAARAIAEAERRAHFIDTADWLRAIRTEIRKDEPPRRRWWHLWRRSSA